MSFLHEVVVAGTFSGVPIAHVYHIGDGAEAKTPDQVADVFENDHIPDLIVEQDNQLTWTRLSVTPLDVGNLDNPVTRVIALSGAISGDFHTTGNHIWIKFISDDNGFKSGGKLFAGMGEAGITDGILQPTPLAALGVIYNALITDLGVAGLFLAIYRPTLSTPGFPSFSVCSNVLVRGTSTNNRRKQPFQQ